MWQADRSPDAPGRLENLKELVVAMAEFENLGGFLEHVSLVMDNAADSAGDMVNLMTLAQRQGARIRHGVPAGLGGRVCSRASARSRRTGSTALEEERRLAYVGLTRARHRAYVSFAANRRIHGQWQSAIAFAFCRRAADRACRDRRRARACGPRRPGMPALRRRRLDRGSRRLGRRWQPGAVGRAGRPVLIESARGAVARPGIAPGRRLLRSATGCFTRNSATARSARSRTTSSPSISSTPATRRSWTPLSSTPDPSIPLVPGK